LQLEGRGGGGTPVRGLPAWTSKEQNQLARHFVCDARATVLFDPRESQVDARGDARRGVDISILDPERTRFDADPRVAHRELIGEFPVRRGVLAVEQSGLGKEKGAYADRPHAANRRSHLS